MGLSDAILYFKNSTAMQEHQVLLLGTHSNEEAELLNRRISTDDENTF